MRDTAGQGPWRVGFCAAPAKVIGQFWINAISSKVISGLVPSRMAAWTLG
ncbi:hypothetical protein O4H61_17410 [Roseovarius aestuarii]|nr:hypothetical protein [Roseovarius aestuarii]